MFIFEEKLRNIIEERGFKEVKVQYDVSAPRDPRVRILFRRKPYDLAVNISMREIGMAIYNKQEEEIVGRKFTKLAVLAYNWLRYQLDDLPVLTLPDFS